MSSIIRRVGFMLLLTLHISAFAQSNYTFTTSTAPYTPISGTSISVSPISTPINIGFSFNFNGVNYSQVIASKFGWLSFNTSINATMAESWREGNLTNTPLRPLIGALYYDNGISWKSQAVQRYSTTGTAPNRVFTFEWYYSTFHWYTNNDICFQVKLYETSNKIEMHYLTVEEYFHQYDLQASIGLAFNSIGDYLAVSSFDANAIASTEFEGHYFPGMPNDNQKYTFTPIPAKAEPTDQCSNLIAQNIAENIMLTWNDAVGTVIPDGYVIMASETNSFIPPTDGTFLTQDNDLSDGSGIVKVLAGKQFYSGWKNAKASTTYYFKAFAYTNGGNRANYNTINAATAQISLVKSAPKNHVTNLTASIVKNKFLLKWNDVKRFGNALKGEYCMTYESCCSYVDCGNNELFNITGNQISLEAWVNPVRYDGGIFQKENVALDGGYRMYLNSQGQLCFGLYIGGSWSEVKTPSGLLPINSWSHICGTYNGTTQSIYISGILVASKSTTGNITSSSVNLFIGRDHNANYKSYEGLIDEMTIWSTARTQAQIVSDMNLNLAGSETGLVAYYKCNNNVEDTTPNAINATIINNEYGIRFYTSNANSDIEGYVIQASNTNSFPALVNGTDVINDLDLADNTGTVKVAQGVQKDSSWINANTNQTYYFRIVPYVNMGSNVVYNTTETIPMVFIKPAPTNHVTNFATSGANGNITQNWTDATGDQLAEGYVILASTSPTITPPVNGIEVSIDNNLADGTGAIKVLPGVQSYSGWINLAVNTTYYFNIYPYSNSGGTINYKTNGTVPQANGRIVIYAEPTNHATGFSATNPGTLTLNWTDALGIPSLMANVLNFDGANDYVTCSGSQNPSVFTAEAWFNTGILNADMAITSTLSEVAGSGFELHVGTNGKPIITMRNSSTWLDVASPTVITANKWTHVAATYDGTTVKLYVDGQLMNSAALPATSFVKGSSPLVIGRRSSGLLFFNGSIEEVRMWNTAKNQAEIQNNMFRELAGTESGLISYYKFNQGTAGGSNAGITTLTDATTNAFNGTLIGFALTGATSNWINPGQAPSGYLIKASTTNSFTDPADGTEISTDNDLSDGVATINISQETQTYSSFTGTKGSTTYYFKIWPYTNTGNYINYKTAATVPTATISLSKPTPITHISNLSASNNNKTITINWTDAPKFDMGNAIALDGTNDYISVADGIIDNSISNAFTIETWIKWNPSSASDPQFICGKGIEQMEIHTAGDAGANGLRFIPVTGVYLDAYNVLPINKWTHVTVVYNASTSFAKMYINGIEVPLVKNGPGTIGTTPQNTTSEFAIGRRPPIASYYLKGNVDEFRVWNSVRSQSEIAANMYKELQGTESNLLAYYKFNQGVAFATNTNLNTVIDATANGLNGSLMGSALSGSSSNWVVCITDVPDGYLIKASKTNNITAPVNGTVVTDDINLSDGIGAVNVLAGVQTYNGWTNFTDTTAYYYKVYPYSNSGTSRVYNTNIPVPVVKDSTGIDQFKEITTTIPNFTQGASAWADYNGDGLLDVLVAGGKDFYTQLQPGGCFQFNGAKAEPTVLYKQVSPGVFTQAFTFQSVVEASIAWADYNNDGLLDFIITGRDNSVSTAGSSMTKLYKQIAGNTFTEVTNPGFVAINNGSASWSDYDNDGDLDVILTGRSKALLYKNNGNGTFTQLTELQFDNVTNSSVAWGDYNNDGKFDLLLTGSTSSGDISKVYQNNGDGYFSEVTSINLPGISNGTVNWIDFNNDGKLDISLNGYIFKNNDNGSFLSQNIGIQDSLSRTSCSWGDFNNDGKVDFVMTGQEAESSSIRIKTTFYEQTDAYLFNLRNDFNFQNLYKGSSDIVDYNNDGNLDLFLTGEIDKINNTCIEFNPYTKLYKNTNFKKNNPPSAPTGLKHKLGQQYTLSWNPSTDLETPSSGITYNIRVGTTKNGCEVVSPMSKTNGYRQIPAVGNCQNNTFAKLALNVGVKYYWSVQAVDNGYKGSEFSAIDSVIIDTIPASNLSLKVLSKTSVKANWTRGNGTRCAVFVKMKNNATLETSKPVNGIQYIGVSRFLSGPSIGPTGWYCVYNGIEDSVIITDLNPTSLYAIHVVEYIDNNGNPEYYRMNSSAKDNYAIFNTDPYLINYTGFNETCTGDFNNDGYLDILNVKNNGGGIFAGYLWKNKGDNDFTTTNLAFETVFPSNIGNINKPSVADFNNDGLLDLVVTGYRDTSFTHPSGKEIVEVSFTNLYKNNGDGTFTQQIGAFSTQVSMGSVSWGDFNNDGKVDLLMCGNPWGARNTDFSVTQLFVNKSTSTSTQFDLFPNTNFVGIQDGSGAWADFNNDGYLDFAISGSENDSYYQDGIPNIARLYRNNKNETFTEIVLNQGRSKRGYLGETCFWNDFDNDGDLDLKIEGDDGFFVVTNNFPDTTFFEGSLLGSFFDYNNKADYDNDGDLDVIDGSIQRNTDKYYPGDFDINQIPNKPTNLRYKNYPGYLLLEWDSVKDERTDTTQISYNIRIREANSNQWLNGYPTLDNGSLLTPNFGNVPFRPNGKNTFAKYNLPVGNYVWQVQSIDGSFGASNWSAESTFTVTPALAEFISTTECLGDSTQFKDNSFAYGGVTSWLWNFGDNTYSTLQNPKHKFTSPGTHQVELTVNGVKSITNSAFVNDTIQVSFTVEDVCAGLATTIKNNTNTNGYIQWQWDFGDNTPISTNGDIDSHSFPQLGTYTVSLTATDANGCPAKAIKKVVVTTTPNATLALEYGNPSFCKGDSVIYSVPFNPNYTYNWYHNNQIITEKSNALKIKTQSGDYKVEVINNLSNTCKNISEVKNIIVKDVPAIPLIIPESNTTFCFGDSVKINAGDLSGVTYQWYRNLGPITWNTNYIVAKETGSYTLTTSYNNGCSSKHSQPIVVTSNVKPSMPSVSYGETSICKGNSVNFSVSNSTDLNLQWFRNNEIIPNATNSTFSATQAGQYHLLVTNSNNNCSNKTIPVEVKVTESPEKPLIAVDGGITLFCPETDVNLQVKNYVPAVNYQWKRSGINIDGANSPKYTGKLSAGDYRVEAKNNECTVESDILTLSTKPAPAKPKISARGPNVWILVCDNRAANIYKWYYNDQQLPTANTYQYVANKNLGDYKVEVNEGGECSTVSDIINIPTGNVVSDIDELVGEIISISPNPSSGIFQVDLGMELIGNIDVQILDSKGALMLSQQLGNTPNFSINLSNHPNGIYLCRITHKGISVAKKIVKLQY